MPQTHNEASGSTIPQMRDEEFEAICLKRTLRQRERSFLDSATRYENHPRLSSLSFGHKKALAEARARSDYRGLIGRPMRPCEALRYSRCAW
jgi:hypothetical protein